MLNLLQSDKHNGTMLNAQTLGEQIKLSNTEQKDKIPIVSIFGVENNLKTVAHT